MPRRQFCDGCGGFGFCHGTCPITTTAQQRYAQRTAYCARIMLSYATGESRAYWAGRLAWAEGELAARKAA